MGDSISESIDKSKSRKNKSNNKGHSQGKPNSSQRYHSENHVHKKRPASKPFQRENDLYVTNKSNFEAQLQKCKTILTEGCGEVYLHSIGNAIRRSINLALTLVDNSEGGFGYEANTSTIELVDDFHPLNDDEDFAIQSRKNSCLHIRIFRRSIAITKPKAQ